MKKRILVLGATGMLGEPVARHLNEAGFQVRILARDEVKTKKIFSDSFEMEQLPRFVVGGQATLIGDRPVPWRWFAADDLGRMVANAYQQEAALNKRFYVHGPEPLTMPEALEQYCHTFYPEIESVTMMPIEIARAAAKSTDNQMLGFFAEMMAYFQKAGEPGDPTEANQLVGAPITTLADWITHQRQMEAA